MNKQELEQLMRRAEAAQFSPAPHPSISLEARKAWMLDRAILTDLIWTLAQELKHATANR